MLQDGSKDILCLCMFCRCSAWSHTVNEKKEWLNGWLQIVICAQWCCIDAELFIRKLHCFRLQQMFLCSYDKMEYLNISLNSNQSGILWQWTCDVELKNYCVILLEDFGSLSYMRHTLEELVLYCIYLNPIDHYNDKGHVLSHST